MGKLPSVWCWPVLLPARTAWGDWVQDHADRGRRRPKKAYR